MEVSKISAGIFLVGASIMALMASSAQAYTFYVGGRDGWISSPSESYSYWAERNRFQVNDTLVFKYKKGDDSVLVVKKEDYDGCNMTNPIEKMDGGDSMFKFDRSGQFYFISGVPEKCKKGQKLFVVVLAVRNKPQPPAPLSLPPAQPPSKFPATPSVPSPSMSPALSPVSFPSKSPTVSPVSSPSKLPVNSPVSSPSKSPATSPVLSPSASSAQTFYVGGSEGWTLSPSESYSHWAETNKFQVNDTLVFKYKKGDDSVLVVKKRDYDACNVTNPIEKMDGGNSTFKFDHSGLFYFISGVLERCKKGQKLAVLVMAARNKPPSATPAPASPPPSLPPSNSPAISPVSSTSKPPATYPVLSPSESPTTSPVASIAPIPVLSPSESPTISPAPSLLAPAQGPVADAPVSTQPPSSSPLAIPSGGFSFVPTPTPIPGPKALSPILSASRASLGLVAMILASAFLN